MKKLAEGEGFEPPVGLLLRLISSQVPLTTQPPFPPEQTNKPSATDRQMLIRDGHA